MASGLLRFYFFPTDFFYPRAKPVTVDGNQQKAVPVPLQDHREKQCTALVLRDLHASNKVSNAIVSFSPRKDTVEKQVGQSGYPELTPLSLSCSVSVPDEFSRTS
ncbi:hypothetical protein Acr_11g0004720 [Actinidia rufa]|uniref:Uncharacterized protein n=1 Tax=Actinidia rufa TaxID=165716 RepID=A0A7J0FCK2_9ERIC|nr:hypothetical protein Acr_11g0004720 [Actinidia rufa]